MNEQAKKFYELGYIGGKNGAFPIQFMCGLPQFMIVEYQRGYDDGEKAILAQKELDKYNHLKDT